LTTLFDGTKKWRRSTHCADGACVEVAAGSEFILMRDSKDPDQPHLSFDRVAWANFVSEVKSGRFQSE
jgi:hypothetical protein